MNPLAPIALFLLGWLCGAGSTLALLFARNKPEASADLSPWAVIRIECMSGEFEITAHNMPQALALEIACAKNSQLCATNSRFFALPSSEVGNFFNIANQP